MRIGALVTLEQLAAHPLVRQRYTALADAAARSASPQIRHVATLGGNLLQRPRCWYFRSAAHRCPRKGGDHCFAFAARTSTTRCSPTGCAIVHPSTAATALVAFGADVELERRRGRHAQRPARKILGGPGDATSRARPISAREDADRGAAAAARRACA